MSKVSKPTASGATESTPQIMMLEARIQVFFMRLQKIYDSSQNITSLEFKTIMGSISCLEQLRKDFLHTLDELNLAKLQFNPELKPDFNSFLAFDEMYCCIIGKINDNKQIVSESCQSMKPKLKLPPINLKTFDGDYQSWPSFFDNYNNTVHYNNSLNNSDKVMYLCGVLSKTALSTISGIPPIGDNYDLIYSALVDKYQDCRTLGTSYLQQLLNIKPLTLQNVDNLNNFLDKFTNSVAAFEKLDIPDKRDFIYSFLALQKLDKETVCMYENSVRSVKLPTYDSLVTFLREQSKILERTASSSSTQTTRNNNVKLLHKLPTPLKTNTKSFVTSDSLTLCSLCNKSNHEQYYRCSQFLNMTPKERYNAVKTHGGCFNCLSFTHKISKCNSNKTCASCKSKIHHTLLHFDRPVNNLSQTGIEPRNLAAITTTTPAWQRSRPTSSYVSATDSGIAASAADSGAAASARAQTGDVTPIQPSVSFCSHTALASAIPNPTTVLLATARVIIRNADGDEHIVRALIDNGSMNDFITSKLCQKLYLFTKPTDTITVNGFGGSSNIVKGVTDVTIFSRFNRNVSFSLHPLVVDNITDRLPTSAINMSRLDYLAGAPLADDSFSEPGEIEMLIGAQHFPRLLLQGHIRGPPGTPDAIRTPLGFILMGTAPLLQSSHRSNSNNRSISRTFCSVTQEPLDVLLRKFWEVEQIPTPRNALLSKDEQACEHIYKSTVTREPSGSYVVALPFKTDPSILGDSLTGSRKRYLSLEKRFLNTPQFRSAYNDIFCDYFEKDYLVPTYATDKTDGYIIPHHGVIREDKLTTKVRLVLDASARTDTNISLNDIMYPGPNLQSDLFLILLNFRLFPIAMCADVEQMYMRIKVHKEFHKFQRILYRFDTSAPIQLFEFKRVCFGLCSSPYLALRTIHQLAEDELDNFPLAANVIRRGDFFMDDIAVSVDNLSVASNTALQLVKMFSSGGFKLHKWSSNSQDLLKVLPQEYLHPHTINFDSTAMQKVLGVTWDPFKDNFGFVVCPPESLCTKRSMLSVIARLWDIMGFAAPLILYAKVLIKELWLLKLGWDDQPPESIIKRWATFQDELPLLMQLTIPRHIGVSESCSASLLAFSDASEKGYGAVIYVRVQQVSEVSVRLLCAKSKIAPVQTISLARLELMGIHLMSKLIKTILSTYWKRWQDEYLHTLQTRQKWNTDSRPVREGEVVLIMRDNSPPLHWPLGIVHKIFFGDDGRVRVALVRTKTGTLKRPIIRLCPLPSLQ